jgi:hypothetical protein
VDPYIRLVSGAVRKGTRRSSQTFLEPPWRINISPHYARRLQRECPLRWGVVQKVSWIVRIPVKIKEIHKVHSTNKTNVASNICNYFTLQRRAPLLHIFEDYDAKNSYGIPLIGKRDRWHLRVEIRPRTYLICHCIPTSRAVRTALFVITRFVIIRVVIPLCHIGRHKKYSGNYA